MAFKPGHKYGKGGARPGGGRPPDWFRDQCAELLEKHKLMDFMVAVARGDKIATAVTNDGMVIPIPAGPKDRMHAIEFLADRAFGKAKEQIEHSGTVTLESVLQESQHVDE